MDNQIKFPTYLIEKKRELSRLEIDLMIQSQLLESKEAELKQQSRRQSLRNVIFFCLGIMFSFSFLILYFLG